MDKIGIKITDIDEFEIKSVAQTLQRFIVEGDYRLSTILNQIQNQDIISLDISKEDKMPEFTSVAEEFDELGVEYQLYKKEKDNSWKESKIEDLNLYRVPKSLILSISIVILGYFVMGVVGAFTITDLYHTKYGFDYIVSFISAVVTSFIPLVGSIVAYISATELWQWSSLKAFIYFFWYYTPIVLYLLYFTYIIIKSYGQYYWYRYRYPEFNS
ncbi:MAG: hypothetical protein GXO60_02465 [Epsilonproteobacteria bacterium]|nr:hypothetical protein [Campylobacterota bacterium]